MGRHALCERGIRWLGSKEKGFFYRYPDSGDQSPGQSRPVEADGGDESRLVGSLEEQVRYLRPQLDEAHRANAEHRQLLAAALARVPALEAPPEAREAPEAASEGVGQDYEGRGGRRSPQSGTRGGIGFSSDRSERGNLRRRRPPSAQRKGSRRGRGGGGCTRAEGSGATRRRPRCAGHRSGPALRLRNWFLRSKLRSAPPEGVGSDKYTVWRGAVGKSADTSARIRRAFDDEVHVAFDTFFLTL
jgi:hypothetical protein